MSIRMIAKDLYRAKQAVEKLEAELRAAPAHRQAELKDRLRKMRAAYQHMLNILEGAKTQPEYRRPR